MVRAETDIATERYWQVTNDSVGRRTVLMPVLPPLSLTTIVPGHLQAVNRANASALDTSRKAGFFFSTHVWEFCVPLACRKSQLCVQDAQP
ncbi:hypothetical protein FKM82_004643 [Ascaphus truei]